MVHSSVLQELLERLVQAEALVLLVQVVQAEQMVQAELPELLVQVV